MLALLTTVMNILTTVMNVSLICFYLKTAKKNNSLTEESSLTEEEMKRAMQTAKELKRAMYLAFTLPESDIKRTLINGLKSLGVII